MNPKAGHSMTPIDPSTPAREAPKARQARSSWQTALPSKATNRDRSPGRTARYVQFSSRFEALGIGYAATKYMDNRGKGRVRLSRNGRTISTVY